MKTLTGLTALAALALGTSAIADTNNETLSKTEVGALNCDIGEGTGFVFGSSKELNCVYNPTAEGAPEETYVGVINKYGIDIGHTEAGVLNWVVVAPTTDEGWETGALAGAYTGVSAEAAVGGGLGANAMLGGSNDTIALQPLSLSASEGVNVAIGISEIELQHVPTN